jgi:hypothetical protein
MWNNNNGFLHCDSCGGRGCDRCRGSYPFPAEPCSPRFLSCGNDGCPILLDTSCSIYHKNKNQISGLINLNLPNGSTLQLILETIDAQLGSLNVNNWNIPFLRSVPYTINNLPQFAGAVDSEFSLIAGQIATLQADVNIPNTSTDTSTVHFVLTGTLSRNISADVKVSAVAGNQLSIQPDGLFSQAQNLSIDYIAKTLTITDGNTVDFSSIVNGNAGFLGNFTGSDPTATDGQYWYRTDTTQLKIKVGGVVKIITIS